jgi:hypothetical protein
VLIKLETVLWSVQPLPDGNCSMASQRFGSRYWLAAQHGARVGQACETRLDKRLPKVTVYLQAFWLNAVCAKPTHTGTQASRERMANVYSLRLQVKVSRVG